MNFEDIWKQLVKKKPSLENDGATAEFTASNLRQLLRQVYDQGVKRGEKFAELKSKDQGGFFDSMFGG